MTDVEQAGTDEGDEVTPHAENLYHDLRNTMLRGVSPSEAHEEIEKAQQRMYGNHEPILALRIEGLIRAYQRVQDELNHVRYLVKRAIRSGREDWYLGPAETGSLWSLHVEHLISLGREASSLELVDTDSGIIVGLLDNPAKEKFSTRGLVVGHVQSGKTGNIAAVIAKSADTQFKFFLVLSGMTDQLRNQTQHRLETDIVALAPQRWMQWTARDTDEQSGDFSEKATGGFGFDHRNQLAVVKKNAAILRRFLAKLKNTDKATLRNTPFLIIDDECDQASVNSAGLDKAISKINDLIRQILKLLTRASYVGYTATPFANVLIDPSVPEDLYPKHFIHAIKCPPDYFGSERLFGRGALQGEYDEVSSGFDMIRSIPDDEIELVRPAKGNEADMEVPASLQDAVEYFIMVIAARHARGQESEHNTMLIHTSVLNSIHEATESLVEPLIDSLHSQLADAEPELLERMRSQWIAEQERVMSEQFDLTPIVFEDIEEYLSEAAASIQVHVENWRALNRLSYEYGPINVIVIGGNVLARGLTLEGLSVSYFLRSSSQYDTLMQMGRWFGYRRAFEDLPRVWVEERVKEAFFDLATIEAEIRRDIARYAEEEITPSDFAVRIRQIPGMTITAAAKMRHAVDVKIGYAGTHQQTFRFSRKNRAVLESNWDAGCTLVDATTGTVEKVGSNAIIRSVATDQVTAFVRSYTPHATHRQLRPEFLAEFISKATESDERMRAWTIVIVGSDEGILSSRPLGRAGAVTTVKRSAEAGSGDDASIKALMSRADIVTDLAPMVDKAQSMSWEALKAIREQRKATPLLLLYPINAKSDPRAATGKPQSREALNAVTDVLGYGIVFPGDRKSSGTYVSANLVPDLSEPEDLLSPPDEIPGSVLDLPAAGEGA